MSVRATGAEPPPALQVKLRLSFFVGVRIIGPMSIDAHILLLSLR